MKCLVILLVLMGMVSACTARQGSESESDVSIDSNVLSSTPTINPATAFKPFIAKFEMYTPGVKRDFSNPQYHLQSSEVFIESADPSVVRVTRSGITWDDFFKTLPFSLSKDCLVTGTKQTFCTNDQLQLRFFLNDVETPNALDESIVEGDFLKVVYE